eukprot:jgi/Bigna1/71230/fgenesh1_pg.15_\
MSSLSPFFFLLLLLLLLLLLPSFVIFFFTKFGRRYLLEKRRLLGHVIHHRAQICAKLEEGTIPKQIWQHVDLENAAGNAPSPRGGAAGGGGGGGEDALLDLESESEPAEDGRSDDGYHAAAELAEADDGKSHKLDLLPEDDITRRE